MSSTVNYNKFNIMWKNDVIAEVTITSEEFRVTQNSNHIKRVFRKPDSEVTRRDVADFVKRQIFDKDNANASKILEELGLSMFDSWGILYKTHGISDRNRFWVKFEGEDLSYEKDIKTRRVLYAS